MTGIGETTTRTARLAPSSMKVHAGRTAADAERVPAIVLALRVAKRTGRRACEVRLRPEVGVVLQPRQFDVRVAEELRLLGNRVLLAVRAVERIDIGEELLGVGLGDIPGRGS